MPTFRKSKFYNALIPEQFSFITGINETVEEKTLIRPHTRYIMAATDYADGISFRKLGLSTDGFGYFRTPFNVPNASRGMGIFNLFGGADNFLTYSSVPFPTSPAYANNSTSLVDQYNYLNGESLLATLIGPSANPVNTQLPCHVFSNFVDILCDYQFLNGIWNNPISGIGNLVPLIQQPATPILAIGSGTVFQYSFQFGSINSPFQVPKGIAFDSSGNIFVVDSNLNSIFKFNSTGGPQAFSLSGQTLSSPTGIFIDSSNNIYVTQSVSMAGHVYKFNASGVFQSAFSGSPSLVSPNGIAQDSGGNFWVCDGFNSNIQKFNSSGVYQSAYSVHGGGTPVGIYIDSSNNQYITVDGGSSPGVQKYNSSQVYQSNFTGYTFSATPWGITVDGSGNFYVVDSGKASLAIFNSSGVFQSSMGSSGNSNGQFINPTYLGFDSTTLFIVDTSNFRVQAFVESGGGQLTGDYAYCYTLIDANGNESQPSLLTDINGLSNNNVLITITPGIGITLSVWQTIRIYRTITSSIPVLASSNPVFYHVLGLDIPVTSATTYTITDSISDANISTPGNNYTLSNVNYINGALAALPVGSVPKFITAWNGQIWGANWIVGNNNYPIRVYWSASTDNSQLSPGNVTSWNSFDYIDVGTIDDGNIIGLWPGLQGRLYVFKEFATYVIEPTGQTSGIIYGATSISSEYGLYHHSIAEIGGAVIGRTKDNIMIFNGTSYKAAGNAPLIRKTVNRCISPEADSGTYDTNRQRYYLAVCDTSLAGSFQTEISYTSAPIETTSIINCFRNTVLAFDIPTSSFEIHHNEPVQVFGKLKDDGGRERIFALGMTGETFMLIEGNFFGANLSFFGTVPSGDTTGKNIQGPNYTNAGLGNALMSGAFLAVPLIINSDGTIQFYDYLTVTSGSTTASGTPTLWPVNNLLPIGNTDITMLTAIAFVPEVVAIGNSGSGAITLTNNLYQERGGIEGYSLYDITSGVFLSNANLSPNINNQELINSTGPFSIATGDKIIIVPYHEYQNVNNNGIPVQAFVTPPMGSRLNDTAKKAFELFRMQIKGNGLLNIYCFKDGNPTYELGPYLCSPDETHSIQLNSNPTTITNISGQFPLPNSYQQMVYLQNQVGYYQRIMLWLPRSSGWFEIQDFTSYYRLMSELDSL